MPCPMQFKSFCSFEIEQKQTRCWNHNIFLQIIFCLTCIIITNLLQISIGINENIANHYEKHRLMLNNNRRHYTLLLYDAVNLGIWNRKLLATGIYIYTFRLNSELLQSFLCQLEVCTQHTVVPHHRSDFKYNLST